MLNYEICNIKVSFRNYNFDIEHNYFIYDATNRLSKFDHNRSQNVPSKAI